ncbi:MAG TPA: recombinase family protein, partial [Lichenihabitans sp.]|nr:recombinase family protein [Lichenihabitans sp.]
MERPALQTLLAAIRERRIDIVVVYKVDRLTRSLTDFARLVELFDEHAVSFVSVTQSFNTTSSMGRLTLNVLLSFAQFEREVTGERIRDKIASSKKKGIWVGGVVPLGYLVQDRKLVIDEAEAATVRLVFERYLALGSLPALQRDLRERNIVTRQRILATGRVMGGVPMTNGPLDHMLRNRMYLGELNHRDSSYPGEHAPIVDRDLFDAVQARLTANLGQRRAGRSKSDALLQGRLFDDRGNRMSPTYAIKTGLRYRYYVSTMLVQGRRSEAGSVSRVPATELERIVLDAITTVTASEDPMSDRDRIATGIERVVVGKGQVELHLTEEAAAPGRPNPIVIAWSPQPMRRRREIIAPSGESAARPIRAEARSKLLAGITRARSWLDEIMSGIVPDIESIAVRETISVRAARMTLSLAFVAPDIVEAAADGILPRGFGLSRLTDLPLSWAEQRHKLGLPARS